MYTCANHLRNADHPDSRLCRNTALWNHLCCLAHASPDLGRCAPDVQSSGKGGLSLHTAGRLTGGSCAVCGTSSYLLSDTVTLQLQSRALPYFHFVRGQHRLSSTERSLDRTSHGLTTRQLIAKTLAGVCSDVMSVKFEEQCFAFIIIEEPHVSCRFMMVLAVLSFLLSQLATSTICIIPSATALRPPSALMDAGASCLQIPIDLVWESIGDV